MSSKLSGNQSLGILFLVLLWYCSSALADSSDSQHFYQKGSQIDPELEIVDVKGKEIALVDLLKNGGKDINIVYIFGGGAMGNTKSAGGIWCPDSFEDLHILRSLVSSFSKQVNFIPIGVPAVYHTKPLGFVERALLDYASDSETYREAEFAYLESTQQAYENGVIPVQPYFDPRFRLIMSAETQKSLPASYGDIPQWQGAFRAADEMQRYGVPHLWILDAQGTVLTDPFRGNIYHPHGVQVNINYTLKDIISVLKELL